MHKALLCPPRVYLPVLCNFRRLYGVVNGDLFQEGYAIPKCAASRAPAPWQSTADPYPTGDAQTQFCLSLSGVPGSFHAQGLFEPSSWAWWEWGLILNTNSPLLPSCWGFSFVLGRGISPHSRSSAYCLTGVSLTLDVGYLLSAAPVPCSLCLPLQCSTAFAVKRHIYTKIL